MADAHDSKSCTFGYVGSIPTFGTPGGDGASAGGGRNLMPQAGPDHPENSIGAGNSGAGDSFCQKKNRNESDFEYGFVKVPGKADKVQALYEGAYGKA